MIDFNENISEPPPTKNISIEDLKKIGNGEKNLTDFIPKVMCHSIGKKLALKIELVHSKILAILDRVLHQFQFHEIFVFTEIS